MGRGSRPGETIQARRKAEFITPIPKPRKQRNIGRQQDLELDDGSGISSARQQYEKTATVINELRGYVDSWRALPDANR